MAKIQQFRDRGPLGFPDPIRSIEAELARLEAASFLFTSDDVGRIRLMGYRPTSIVTRPPDSDDLKTSFLFLERVQNECQQLHNMWERKTRFHFTRMIRGLRKAP